MSDRGFIGSSRHPTEPRELIACSTNQLSRWSYKTTIAHSSISFQRWFL